MQREGGFSWTGLALLILGLWLVLRTVRSDRQGNTLVNWIEGTQKQAHP